MTSGRILITGATGFVGRSVARRLAEARLPLTLAVRRIWSGEPPADSRVVAVGEIGPETDWGAALADATVVIHLAAHVHIAPERAAAEAGLFDRVNHLGSLRLYEAASARGVRLFMFLSSITVLGGASPPGRPFDETTALAPETPYGRSKLDAERALEAAYGPPLVILRPPLIAGEGVAGNLGSLARLAARPIPLPFGATANRRTLLSLQNLCSAIETAIARPVPGTYVLGDRDALSTGDLVAALREGMGRASWLLPIPPALMRGAASLIGRGGDAQRLLGDLEVDASRFRSAHGWRDEVDTRTTLAAIGCALRTVPPRLV